MSRQRQKLGVLAVAALILLGPSVPSAASVPSVAGAASWSVGKNVQGRAAAPAVDEDPGFAKRRQEAQAKGLIDSDGRVPGSQRLGLRAWPRDDTGYRVQERDLAFLGLTRRQVDWWRRFQAPLGTTPRQFKDMSSSLYRALCGGCERPEEYDVRLQGSWAFFFSGRHKDFPTEQELAGQPVALERFREWMGAAPPAERPARRPFDSLYRLGALDEKGMPVGPSDGDFHLSSDVMVETARRKWDELKNAGKLSEADLRTGFFHQKYHFVNRTAVREAFPDLARWATVWKERLGRAVAPSVFPSAGPPDKSQVGNGVSTHYRDSDWVVPFPVRRG
ncbi:hypothetical protein OG875_16010 [Streptomyces sp. NBC_01498]|uniref:hypothetical protein n=1 Tax=Streptomyces sp. NBC_01498 TaxID=2975870 RepID=UPI002E7B1404|nr:hypothetical protein [Streptomyces sp. NBC_01498]WTL25973.1 hypothetical protein OG875_16010 [Streptomyces sp. NBC_01498]